MRTKNEYYKLAVENAPIHIILTDSNGKILYANSAVENITKFKHKEIIGKNPRLWGQQMSKDFYKNFWNTIKTKKEVFRGELINKRKNGERYIAKATVKPIVEDNRVIGFVGIEQDVTNLRKTQRSLSNSVKKLKKSNNLKDMFMDIMRHDILNPLTVIKSYTELLADKKNRPDKKILSAMFRSVNNTIEIIDNAKKYAKIEDVKSFEMEELDLKKIISDVVYQVSPRYKNAGIRLINKINEKTVLSLNPLISEVFLNFLTNALKYAPKRKKVIIAAENKGSNLLIKVTDFGEGIPDRYKKAIFSRFSRQDKEGVEGTGLGLSIVTKIVELHKGKVWVEDNPKGGSTFVVSLPFHTIKKIKTNK